MAWCIQQGVRVPPYADQVQHIILEHGVKSATVVLQGFAAGGGHDKQDPSTMADQLLFEQQRIAHCIKSHHGTKARGTASGRPK